MHVVGLLVGHPDLELAQAAPELLAVDRAVRVLVCNDDTKLSALLLQKKKRRCRRVQIEEDGVSSSVTTVLVEDVLDVPEAVLEAWQAHGDAVHRPEYPLPVLGPGPLPERRRHLVVEVLLRPPALHGLHAHGNHHPHRCNWPPPIQLTCSPHQKDEHNRERLFIF